MRVSVVGPWYGGEESKRYIYTTIDVSYIPKYLHQYDLYYILTRNNRCQLHHKVPIRARIANRTRELNVTAVATYTARYTKYVNIFISVHLDDAAT